MTFELLVAAFVTFIISLVLSICLFGRILIIDTINKLHYYNNYKRTALSQVGLIISVFICGCAFWGLTSYSQELSLNQMQIILLINLITFFTISYGISLPQAIYNLKENRYKHKQFTKVTIIVWSIVVVFIIISSFVKIIQLW